MITSLWNNAVLLSLIGSVMYLAIWVFGKVFRKIPARVNVLLYGLLALRLVIPYSWSYTLPIHAPYSLIESNLVQTHEGSQTQLADLSTDPSSKDSNTLNPNVEPYPVSPLSAPDSAANFSVSSFDGFGWVWLGGIILILGYGLVRFIQLQKRLATAIRYQDRIWISDQIEDPFVWGLFTWKVEIPSSIDSSCYPSILAHETAHINRLDPVWKVIAYFLLAIYWFNPILWFAYSSFNKEIEKACDEKAVQVMNASQKADYAKALLACSFPRKRRFLFLVPCFGNLGLKERISLIHTPKKLSKAGLAGMAVLSMILVGCLGAPKTKTTVNFVRPINDASTWYSSVIYKPEAKNITIQSSPANPDLNIQAITLDNHRTIEQPIKLDGGAAITLADVTGEFRLWVQRVKPGNPEEENEVDLDIDGAAAVELDQAIEQVKTPYVGDVSAIGKVLNAMPFPPDWSIDSVSLQTDQEPYGVTVNFICPNDPDALTLEPYLLENCAAFAFGAIENLGVIHFVDSISGDTLASFNREQTMSRIQVKIGRADVVSIQIDSGLRGEGMSYADGSPLKQGEVITFNDLAPGTKIKITAYDQNNDPLYTKTVLTEDLQKQDLVDGDWIISLIPEPLPVSEK